MVLPSRGQVRSGAAARGLGTMQESSVLLTGDQSDEFEQYDRLAGMVGNPPSDHSILTAVAAEVVANLRTREREHSAARARRITIQAQTKRNPPSLWLFEITAWIVTGSIALSMVMQNPWTAASILVLMFLAAWINSARKRSITRCTMNPIETSLNCPRCRYDLTGLPDSIPHEWIAAHSGPRRCPECGEPWPMVPRLR